MSGDIPVGLLKLKVVWVELSGPDVVCYRISSDLQEKIDRNKDTIKILASIGFTTKILRFSIIFLLENLLKFAIIIFERIFDCGFAYVKYHNMNLNYANAYNSYKIRRNNERQNLYCH